MLRDNAKRMDTYNNSVIDGLIRKTTLKIDTIREWFAESREGWLSGVEALDCELADEMTDAKTEKTPLAYLNNRDFQGNEKIVAMADIARQFEEKLRMATRVKAKCGDEVEKPTAAEIVEKPQQDENEHFGEEIELLKRDVETLKEAVDALKAEIEKTDEQPVEEEKAEDETTEKPQENENEHFGEEIELLKKEIETLKEENAKLTAGLRTGAQPAKQKTFLEYAREIPKGLTDKAYCKAFEALKKAHEKEYAEYMNSHKTR